jgi:hypothetical protein
MLVVKLALAELHFTILQQMCATTSKKRARTPRTAPTPPTTRAHLSAVSHGAVLRAVSDHNESHLLIVHLLLQLTSAVRLEDYRTRLRRCQMSVGLPSPEPHFQLHGTTTIQALLRAQLSHTWALVEISTIF